MTAPGAHTNLSEAGRELLPVVQRIATEVSKPAAGSVDKEPRFPNESFAALRDHKLLSAAIPREFGGLGCTLLDVATFCTTLGSACASSAMVYAMHAIQVACMAKHGAAVPFFQKYLRTCAEKQLLVASGTSEAGVGGDMRSSIAAIERAGGKFKLQKSCSVMSYGEQADAVLISARASAESAAGDQALVLIRKEDYTLDKLGVWDTLGMRGTCSPPFKVTAEASVDQILPEPFGTIASATMVPYSHVVWSSCWLGLASDAVSTARAMLRQDARKRPGTTPFGSSRLVEAVTLLQIMKANILETEREYERVLASADALGTLTSITYALKINNLKLASSQLVAQICQLALGVCGVMCYSNTSKFSVGRHLRDALGAPLMIANDRINATNAGLLLVSKDDSVI